MNKQLQLFLNTICGCVQKQDNINTDLILLLGIWLQIPHHEERSVTQQSIRIINTNATTKYANTLPLNY